MRRRFTPAAACAALALPPVAAEEFTPPASPPPDAHSIIIDPSTRFAFVADLGADKVFVYRFNEKDGSLAPNNPPCVTVAAGSGPRHFAFDPAGKWILCSNHGGDVAVVSRVDEKTGKLTQTGQPVSVPYPFCERFLSVR
jgi:6-phosphogluconolactonase